MLFCLTASHRDTDFDLLDRISAGIGSTAADARRAPGVRGAIVLATCNRFEAYLDVEDDVAARDIVLDALSGATGDDAHALAATAQALTGTEVVRHLFAVTAGLESMVVGEDEISGQVQRALTAARAEGTSSPELERLFQRAARTSRDVRAATDLGGAGRSVARLALDLAASRIADWADERILVVGTGRYAATTIAALRARGAVDIRVFSATGRADAFAVKYAVRAEHDLRAAIADAGLVITCTARYTVGADDLTDSSRRLIIDLGLPRNVDPTVGRLPGVELLDLELLALHAALPELDAGAHALVGSAAAEYAAEREAAPGIVALRRHVMTALDAELERARRRGADAATEEALRHLAGVLVHTPSVRARELAAEGRTVEFEDALRAIFGIQLEADAEDRPLSEKRDESA
ncbi:MAG TPA: glutamyl-tRNA reductase [Pseudolysinimonas sp.]|nr:glutamyl-tRNA reductase [Pseudolysinimonas sp.]